MFNRSIIKLCFYMTVKDDIPFVQTIFLPILREQLECSSMNTLQRVSKSTLPVKTFFILISSHVPALQKWLSIMKTAPAISLNGFKSRVSWIWCSPCFFPKAINNVIWEKCHKSFPFATRCLKTPLYPTKKKTKLFLRRMKNRARFSSEDGSFGDLAIYVF